MYSIVHQTHSHVQSGKQSIYKQRNVSTRDYVALKRTDNLYIDNNFKH